MKKLLMLFCAAGLIATTSCNNGSSTKELKNNVDSLSYYIGSSFGEGVKQQIKFTPDSTNLDAAALVKGIEAALSDTANHSYTTGVQLGLQLNQMMQGAKMQFGIEIDKDIILSTLKQAVNSKEVTLDPNMSQAKINEIIQKIQTEKTAKEVAKNEAAAKEFLDKQMQADKDIKVTESGLAYKVIKEGQGAKLTDTDKAFVIYTGTFTDGKKFDSSNGKAAEFNVNGVVPGFTEALKMMAPGAHYVVYIPGKLGYGEHGQPYAGIGPNQMLVFDIEVVTEAEAKKLNEQPSKDAEK